MWPACRDDVVHQGGLSLPAVEYLYEIFRKEIFELPLLPVNVIDAETGFEASW
jgi:hypothetical protein